MAVNPVVRSVVFKQWGADIISGDGSAIARLVNPRHAFPNLEAAIVASLKAGINQYDREYAAAAGRKAFVVNRIGDFGFLLGRSGFSVSS